MGSMDPSKLRKALEKQGLLNVVLEQHGDIRIQLTNRNVTVEGCDKPQKRVFICVSSPSKPETDSMNKASFNTIIQAAWDQFHPVVTTQQDGLETRAEENTTATIETTATTTPQQQEVVTPAPTTTRAISPSAGSPQVLKDDNDLLEFFSSILSAECLHKADLFVPNTSSIVLRKKLKSFGMQLAANDHQTMYNSFHDAPLQYLKEDITTLEPDPCLTNRFGIPMSVPAMSEVAQAIINLAEKVPEILQLSKHGGSKGHGKRIITIVPSSDPKRLYYNAKLWMESLIDNATTNENEDTYDTIHTLVRVLHTLDPLAVEAAASDLCNGDESIQSQYKLDPKLQQAMMFKAGLNLTQMRTIKSHCCYSNLDMFQPESEMKRLRVTEHVRPTSMPFKDGGTRSKVAWTVPASDLLLWNGNNALNAQSFDYDKLQEAHVIIVSDHGKGAFRMMATLLLITREGRGRRPRNSTVNPYIGTKLALEVDGMIGYVQCQKDTYKVLDETIATPINDDLRYIKDQKELTVYRKTDGSVEMCWGKPTNDCTILQAAPVKLFMTGDLAFYSMVLGKEYAAKAWCWRCQQSKKEWSPDVDDYEPKPLGEPWTIDLLKSHFAKLQSGELDKLSSAQKLGVTALPLFDCIPVENILVPPLHNTELFVNTPIKSFLLFIHHRIEKLPQELIDAREEHVDLCLQKESAESELSSIQGSIKHQKAERTALRPPKRNGVVRFKDDDHRLDFEDIERLLAQSQTRKQACLKRLASLRLNIREAARKVTTIETKKEYGALSQEVRQRIEQMLQDVYQIIRSAYHGGDFEGNHCRKFLRRANEVMDSIQVLLLEIPQTDRDADDDEIRRYCRGYKRLFQYMDLLVHYIQQPFGTLSDDDMANVRKLVGCLDRLWRRLFKNVPLKTHGWGHLVVDLERFRGLKHHQESKIEVAHQVGRKIDLLFRAVNDIEKKIDSSLSHQHTMAKPEVQLLQGKVAASQARKRKAVDDGNECHGHADRSAILNLPEIDDFFPSLLELAKTTRMWANETG